MSNRRRLPSALLALLLAGAASATVGCGGDKGGPEGTGGADGTDGADVTDGADGTDGTDGTDGGGDTGDPDCVELADGTCVEPTWVDIPELEAVDGVHSLTLAPTELEFDGKRHCGRAYNGSYVAPTLVTEAREGDSPRQIRIDLTNAFTQSDYRSLEGDDTCACLDADGMAGEPAGHGGCDDMAAHGDCTCTNSEGEECHEMYNFNLTNLHAHGSHIRPDAAAGGGCVDADGLACRDCDADVCDGDRSDDTCFFSDDVLTQVGPGEGAHYRWDIDEDGTHHDGLNWYHPHIHGTTAIQVSSGAAGAWIIRGPVDAVPGMAEARERVLVFSTPPVGDNGFVELAEGEDCRYWSVFAENRGGSAAG